MGYLENILKLSSVKNLHTREEPPPPPPSHFLDPILDPISHITDQPGILFLDFK